MYKLCFVLIVSISVVFICNTAFCEFIINGDGTVTDTSTGLIWQREIAGEMTWEGALTYCEALSLGGHNDWRLPNINELQSILDYSVYGPAINTDVFPDTISSLYWSSTTGASNPGLAWLVDFYDGYVYYGIYQYDKSDSYHVRAVRSVK